jgi:hypothetical protein
MVSKWLSRDPLGESTGVNLYDYVMNNPVDLYDPLGLCPRDRQHKFNGDPAHPYQPDDTPYLQILAGFELAGVLEFAGIEIALMTTLDWALLVDEAGLGGLWRGLVDDEDLFPAPPPPPPAGLQPPPLPPNFGNPGPDPGLN